ncbi:MAG: MoaD/ThiS family protein [Theionarchaea archaeon]|nr:MAG: hypothetical protein AYK19_01750 [Theionarchaea archaeon DG-70-1]MBU7026618.1 MoaD/ThiS family protein [Theionarchaea archaeon]
MVIKVKLYGNLREKASRSAEGAPGMVEIEDRGIKMVSDVLNALNIDEAETSHLFVNGKYSGLRKKVKNGDRVAIFPKNMGLLYKWYFRREENDQE